jgi:hypothetical protein
LFISLSVFVKLLCLYKLLQVKIVLWLTIQLFICAHIFTTYSKFKVLFTFNCTLLKQIFFEHFESHIKNVLQWKNVKLWLVFLYLIPWKHPSPTLALSLNNQMKIKILGASRRPLHKEWWTHKNTMANVKPQRVTKTKWECWEVNKHTLLHTSIQLNQHFKLCIRVSWCS